MRHALLLAGGAFFALSSVWVGAQDAPESLLPPGFERPAQRPPRPAATTAPAAPAGNAEAGPASTSIPVIQRVPGGAGGSGGSAGSMRPDAPRVRVPTLRELEALSPDQLDDLLGLRPKTDMPPAARRSLKKIGILAEWEGGFPSGSLAGQNASLIKATLAGNRGMMVSRWGHILVRRALASRLDAPTGLSPADFTALRAGLLVRMGEGDVARQLVQDVDAGNYNPALTQAAINAYVQTADFTGICPVVAIQGGLRKDTEWAVLRAICGAFQGEGSSAMAQLDKLQDRKAWPMIDLLLAQKYAGAAGKARRAVKIEWDGVKELTPWRYGLTIATGLEPPAELLQAGAARYAYTAATAPMVSLPVRAAGADLAASAGILSGEAMVDLYSQIYAQTDIKGDWAKRADLLRSAYVAQAPRDRLTAMQQLWDAGSDERVRYSRMILTSHAAARLPVTGDFADQNADLIASMLSAGLDRNALRWANQASVGSLGWALLALAAPNRETPAPASALNSFYGEDDSEDSRKSKFLLAGMAGLGRIDDAATRDFAAKLEVDLGRQTRWTTAISAAADVNNQALVALLAGVGLQGNGWDKMTALHLYHIVSALNRVGLSAEARMIAAEAVSRG